MDDDTDKMVAAILTATVCWGKHSMSPQQVVEEYKRMLTALGPTPQDVAPEIITNIPKPGQKP